jgi:flagellar hook-associated protein 2
MTDSIGSNIIGALGAGSGINSRNIADQLTEIERAPRQQQIDDSREQFESQISDFGLVRGALSTLQDMADTLKDSATFNSKTASFSDSDAFIPLALEEEVPTGSYSFEVIDVAQSQSLSTATTYTDPTDAVGKGSLTINFGAWDTGNPPTTFTQDTSQDALVITIDDTNNSLNGLRDAINNAEAGVTASIINDGAGYRLLLTADSGLNNQMEITAVEDAGSSGLAAFDYRSGAQTMDLSQVGKDAELKVNGLTVNRSENEIDDVIEGFRFNLAKADPGNIVSVTITEDKAGGEQAVRDFVDTFNAFLEAIEPAVGFNEEEQDNGSLFRDPTARSLQSQIRNLIASSIPGLADSGFTALTNVGIRTELDGTLTINEDDLRQAFDDNYDLVKSLFSPQTSSSADKVLINSFRDESVPGSYTVEITQDPEKGQLVGAAAAGTLLADLATASTSGDYTGGTSTFAGGLDIATQGKPAGDYDFDLAIDGGTAVTISLPIADYADRDAIATALQSEIDAAGLAADIVYNIDKFVVTSRSTGSNSSVAISNLGPSASEFDFLAGSATAGTGPNADDYDFTISVNGTASGTISLTRGVYADEDALAAHIQAQVNNDATLNASGADVDVVWNGDHFEITSRTYGAKSNVSVTDVGSNAADLGLGAGSSSAGKDVEGTWDGVTGFGVGNVLLPKLDTDPYGLSLIVQPGAPTTTITYSRGFGSELSLLIDSYLESNGILDNRESTLQSEIDELDEDQSTLDRRMDAFHERLMAQFLAMERIVNSLNSSGSALDDIAKRLPFTASSN